jgi:hypothetical protein
MTEIERAVRRRFQQLRGQADDFAEVDRLQDDVDELVGLAYQQGHDNGIEASQARITWLVAANEGYTAANPRHQQCAAFDKTGPCTCGYDDLQEALYLAPVSQQEESND